MNDTPETLQTAPEGPEKAENTKLRTRKDAGKTSPMPSSLPIITNQKFRFGMSLHQSDTAYLLPLTPADAEKLKFEDGKLYFDGKDATKIDLINISTNTTITDIDLMTLRFLYAIILGDLQELGKDAVIEQAGSPQFLGRTTTIYLPDFLRTMGLAANYGKPVVNAIINKFMSYRSILGVMTEHVRGRTYRSKYPVMLFMGYNDKDNTLSFASPYINQLIANLTQATIRRDKQGKIVRSKSGAPLSLPSHSYLIDTAIVKERNKRAAEIVCLVVNLIENAGDNTPHIRAATLIEQHEELKQALEQAKHTNNKNTVLKRAFSKAWELLPKYTRLQDVYADIKLPSPSEVPTISTLDMVFSFPHNGKKRSK